MLKFSANISMLFTEVDFLSRFERAAKFGFRAVECQFPYQWKKEQLVDQLHKNGLSQVLQNLPAGNWARGERGIACLPDRVGEFQESVMVGLEYAEALQCTCLNCLAGIPPKDTPIEIIRRTLVNNLRFAADALAQENIRLLVEPLNKYDMPGFYLNTTNEAVHLFEEVGHPNLWLQYDIYHMQVMEGNLAATINANLPHIAHIQLADNPGRHQPGTGEINFPNLLGFINAADYKGWIGCEYVPLGSTEESLGWIKAFL
jgi:hydroxypyruvate isomerase